MLRILVNVTPDRDRAARVRIFDGAHTISDDWGSASVDSKIAARAGNAGADPLRPAGHPPLGRYELIARGTPPAGTEAEYGRALLLFDPVAGQALDAEAYGRLALLLYAGRPAPNMQQRRTQGGVRIAPMAMDLLLVGLGDDTPVELRIEPSEPRPWWAFWRRKIVHPPLSDRPPQFDVPPLDEASLMSELMKNAVRRSRATRRDDDEVERLWDRSRDSRTSSDEGDTYRGRGGEGGGAGASGSWSDAPTPGRGPGVDAAGRIATAAGVAGAAAVAAATVMASRDARSDAAASTSSAGNPGAALEGTPMDAVSIDAGERSSSDDTSAAEASFVDASSDSTGDGNWSSGDTSY